MGAEAMLPLVAKDTELLLHRILQMVPPDVPVTGRLEQGPALKAVLSEIREGEHEALVISVADHRRWAKRRALRQLLRSGQLAFTVVVA